MKGQEILFSTYVRRSDTVSQLYFSIFVLTLLFYFRANKCVDIVINFKFFNFTQFLLLFALLSFFWDNFSKAIPYGAHGFGFKTWNRVLFFYINSWSDKFVLVTLSTMWPSWNFFQIWNVALFQIWNVALLLVLLPLIQTSHKLLYCRCDVVN